VACKPISASSPAAWTAVSSGPGASAPEGSGAGRTGAAGGCAEVDGWAAVDGFAEVDGWAAADGLPAVALCAARFGGAGVPGAGRVRAAVLAAPAVLPVVVDLRVLAGLPVGADFVAAPGARTGGVSPAGASVSGISTGAGGA
jgi:hypothetical protein